MNLEINCPKGFDDVHEALKARADFLHPMGLLAGKWPHGLALQPGAATRAIEVQEKARIRSILYAFGQFVEASLFGDDLENVIALGSVEALDVWREKGAPDSSDFRHFLHIADALDLALVDAPVRAGEVDPVAVQHIVRSFDPCMVCTVH